MNVLPKLEKGALMYYYLIKRDKRRLNYDLIGYKLIQNYKKVIGCWMCVVRRASKICKEFVTTSAILE
jgi:hypothetical protein